MKNSFQYILALLGVLLFCGGATTQAQNKNQSKHKIRAILDTDANNELDDQHAIAYLLFNHNIFDVAGITVNATENGGNIDAQYAEAERVMKLCEAWEKIPLLKGANGSFEEIVPNLKETKFDGINAVDFIVKHARDNRKDKLVVIAIGKLTNIALAVKKDPSITKNIRLVWLGSNYPKPGEYNLVNDIPAMNYLLKTNIDFEMVTVRYGEPSGTDAVRITKEEVSKNMPGVGPRIKTPIVGRHGGTFSTFGDYSVSLFEHAQYFGNPPSRALFDMAAVAIVKNPEWAQSKVIPCPIMVEKKWVEQPETTRKITIWENFDKEGIMKDFFHVMKNPNLH